MIIFKDVFNDNEMFSEALMIKNKREGELVAKCREEGPFYIIRGDNATEKSGVDSTLLGANPSQEEADEGTCDEDQTGIDIVLTHKLVPMGDKSFFGQKPKDGAKSFFKAYVGALKEKIPEEKQEQFKADSQEFVKAIFKKLDDLEFYVGKTAIEDGDNYLLIPCLWGESLTDKCEDEGHAYFYFFKHGLLEEKY